MAKKEGTALVQRHSGVTNGASTVFEGEKKFQEIFQLAISTRNVCPVRDIMDRVSDKWSILTIYALGGYGTLRFNELKNKIGDISQRMLTVTLRNLETDGFIVREIFAEVPPRVEYRLTELGYSLMQQFAVFAQWAMENGDEIIKSRKRKSRLTSVD